MRGQKQDAFPAGKGSLEVLESLINHNFADILVRVLWEAANFGNLPA